MEWLSTGRAAGIVLTLSFVVSSSAAAIDVAPLFPNLGFENGNLNGWSITRPNDTYVTVLSPPVNPSINPADPADDPTTLTAPIGGYFVGLKRPGDTGPDLKYKLAHNPVSIIVPTGTTFEVTVFANRGRLEPYDTPGSTADVLVRIFGWGAGSLPTVDANDNWSRSITWNSPSQSFDFTGVPDGSWGSRTFQFDPAAQGVDAGILRFLSISVAGRNNNHDQYVATDFSEGLVPVEPATWGSIKRVYR